MARSKLQILIDEKISHFSGKSVNASARLTDEILAVIRLEKINTRKARTRVVHRDAITGKFLPKEVAETRPNTTILQKIKQRFLPK